MERLMDSKEKIGGVIGLLTHSDGSIINNTWNDRDQWIRMKNRIDFRDVKCEEEPYTIIKALLIMTCMHGRFVDRLLDF